MEAAASAGFAVPGTRAMPTADIEESYGPKFIQVDKGIADLIRKEV